MSTKGTYKLRIAVVAINVLLLAPLVLKFAPLPSFKLAGASSSNNVPEVTRSAWFEGSFQESCNAYASSNFAARDWYVRSYNQIDYALFNKANARYVVVGKNNCLFESGYLDAYRGKDFLGEDKIAAQVQQIKEVQLAMQKQGKLLLPIIAPGKASYYSEYIPDAYQKKLAPSNYELFTKALAEQQIQHIDFSKWILEHKTKSKYPLYPLSGIHWSNYAALQCFDSILGFTTAQLNCVLPRVKIKSVKFSEHLQYPDNDIADGLNLLFPLKNKALAYADYEFTNKDSSRLNVITIADSFWWYIYSQALPQRSFKQHQFWYYNELMYPQSESSETKVATNNYFAELRKADVVIILYSESNLHRYSDGALLNCFETFCKPNTQKEKLQQMKANIMADKEWYAKVLAKAAQKRISPDSMLTLDAAYMLQQLP